MRIIKSRNKIIILFVLIFSIGLISCSDTSQQNKPTDKLYFKTKEEAITSVYNSFLYEKTVCQNFVTVIAEDNDFVKKFGHLSYDEREKTSVFDMLSKSKVANNEIVQYMLKNNKYFFIITDYPDCLYSALCMSVFSCFTDINFFYSAGFSFNYDICADFYFGSINYF